MKAKPNLGPPVRLARQDRRSSMNQSICLRYAETFLFLPTLLTSRQTPSSTPTAARRDEGKFILRCVLQSASRLEYEKP